MSIPTRDELVALYRRRARRYDFTANLYYLIGFREWAYRKKAVEALGLRRGDTVVEIGCGTGLNFPLFQEAVGPEGKIVGVDLTDAMLAQARTRVNDRGWKNVELVHSDAASYRFREAVDGVISTFALTLVPEFDDVIRNGCQALKPGKRWVVLDFKRPSNWLSLLASLLSLSVRPFGATIEMAERHPWESMGRCLSNIRMTELYLGFAYVAVGERGDANR